MTPTESAARHWSEALTRLGACSDAVLWACTQPTYEEAWQTCTRLDWLLWLVARTMGERSRMPMVLAACDIVESVLHLVPAGEERPRKAIEVTRAWCAGQATAGEVDAASDAARDAASVAACAARDAAWAASDAAWDAAWAASDAAWDAAWAAWAAARAARAARAAASAAAWAAARAAASTAASAAARTAQDKRSCDLIRARCERPVLPCDGGAT